MSAPNLIYSVTGNAISSVSGFDSISVSFSADSAYQSFQCRATKIGEAWGVGKGVLVASFSSTPANTERTFEIYDDYLTSGDGEYRISLFAQGEDGSWNDNYSFIPVGVSGMLTSDGKQFLCMKE